MKKLLVLSLVIIVIFAVMLIPQVQAVSTPQSGVIRYDGDYLYPSPLADTYGTSFNLLPSPGFTALVPLKIAFLTANMTADERVYFQATVTFSDNTSQSVNYSVISNVGNEFTWNNYMALMKDGVSINELSFAVKSSLATSNQKTTFWVAALNQ